MKSKTLLTGIFIFLILVLLNPFIWVLCGSTHFRQKVIEQLVHKSLVSEITRGITSDTEKALKIFDYIDTHIFHKTRMDVTVIDTDFLKYLIKGTAYCDQQAHTLMDLAKKADLKARVLFLRGYDSVSHHTVCELYLDGKFRIFDTDFGYIFINNNDEIATFSDIQKHGIELRSDKLDSLLSLNKDFAAADYFRLYEPTYKFTVANTNFKIHPGRMLRAGVIDFYYGLFGRPFLTYLQDLYFKVENVDLFLKARVKHLSFRFQSAVNDYNNVNENKNIFIASESLFFKGQLFWDMKDYNRCISIFEELLLRYPGSRWAEEACFYLGDAYENIKEIDKARSCYSKIKNSHTTPAPRRLMKLIMH